jgi:hypothetical protein
VTLAHVNGLIAALFPANNDFGSVVTVEPVMCRKSLCRLASL